jgi:light-regulated signal transduction histidine kinase (bacteriophytochrome)
VESPAFGQADLSNCERELIHLPGSIQPHGVLLLLSVPDLVVLQASGNCGLVFGWSASDLLQQPISVLGGGLATRISAALPTLGLEPALVRLGPGLAGARCSFEMALHRPPGGGVVVELEPMAGEGDVEADALAHRAALLQASIAAAVQRFAAAASLSSLADSVVQVVRDLSGYDRVMVYRFDPDGHGQIIAEARDPALESLLDHRYPASDIPQRARELYLRNRVRVLVDVNAEQQALLPPLRPDSGEALDMSMCQLRSMSPLHLQYLRNMGVTGTLVASLVREGRLWGLIAAHHYRPRRVSLPVRLAVELLAEVAATRISAIENYAHAQVALLVRRLEQRLVEATAVEGDWRQAVFRNPRTLLQPLDATGAALFHDGEILTAGDVPSTPELRALCRWVDAQPATDRLFACSSIARAEPTLASLKSTACGVLSVRLSTTRPDFLMWFRQEQLQTLTWGGDPRADAKASGPGEDPLQLSPRRSFATWSEIVRDTALPWRKGERTMARSVGFALVDIILQVNAVRLLIAERQLAQIRATVDASQEAVLVTHRHAALVFANQAFLGLRGTLLPVPHQGMDATTLFRESEQVRRIVEGLELQPWRGEWTVESGGVDGVPVAAHAEAVPGPDGDLLGFIVTLTDLRDTRRAARARDHLELALLKAGASARPSDEVIGAILTNASLAAMDVAESEDAAQTAPLLEELEASAERATSLYGLIRRFSA